MAITKIWTVKSRLDTCLNYVSNPEKTSVVPNIDAREGVIKYITNQDKTEKCKYVSAYGCSEDRAFSDMMETQKLWQKHKRKNGVAAYHIVQSFKDFEVSPDVAHKCGKELVERLFGKYECIVATHVDHKHIHNHIVINSTSFIDGSKYKNKFKDYFTDIRGISDAICREHGLSVIENPKHKGMHYAEWLALKEGKPTIRGRVREDIDEIIKSSYTMKEFWKILEERGFTICRRKPRYEYTSFIPPYGVKQIRLDKLGPQYTEEAINERITAARNGIRITQPTELSKKNYRIKGSFDKIKPIKLKGFTALYFHYMYLFKIIRKKKAPQRVSFFMREELVKFERYQKQFKFLNKYNIENGTQLMELKKSMEDKINDLVAERIAIYQTKNKDNEQEVTDKAKRINSLLNDARKEIRMCNAILSDSYKISQKYKQAKNMIRQAEMEMKANEHKRRGR